MLTVNFIQIGIVDKKKTVLYETKNHCVQTKDDTIDIKVHTNKNRTVISAMMLSLISLLPYQEDLTDKLIVEETDNGVDITYSLTPEQIKKATVVDLLLNIITDEEETPNES